MGAFNLDARVNGTVPATAAAVITSKAPSASLTQSGVTSSPITASTPITTDSGKTDGQLHSESIHPAPGQPTPTATSSAAPGKKGIDAGGAAGLAIGFLILGVLLALLGMFLFRKFRGKKHGTGSSLGAYANEKGPSVGVREVGFSDASFVESNLPQPVEDNAVITEVGVLRDRISGHVKSYYDLSTPGLTAAASAIDALGLRVPTPRLLALLADPNSRAAALQYLISATIISRCELGSDPNESFLPFEIAVSLQKMQKSNLDPKGAYTISIHNLCCGEQVLL